LGGVLFQRKEVTKGFHEGTRNREDRIKKQQIKGAKVPGWERVTGRKKARFGGTPYILACSESRRKGFEGKNCWGKQEKRKKKSVTREPLLEGYHEGVPKVAPPPGMKKAEGT